MVIIKITDVVVCLNLYKYKLNVNAIEDLCHIAHNEVGYMVSVQLNYT